MKYFSTIIDLPRSMYVVETDPKTEYFLIRLAGIILAILIFDLSKTISKTIGEVFNNLIKNLTKNYINNLINNLITPILPAPGVI